MGAELEAKSGGPASRPPQSLRTQQLAAAVRAAAASAADEAGGGVALVFASAPGDTAPEAQTRLRAAAGFPSAQAAREVAQALQPKLREALGVEGVSSYAADPILGERAAAGLLIHPLSWEGRVHGALLVGCPAPLDEAHRQVLAHNAEVLALRFDHAQLADSIDRLADEGESAFQSADQKNEEILKLSEALFAQDIELLRNNEKLGKIEKLKTDFIERMSRELRTPLNSIIEAIISVLTGENEALSATAKESLRCALDDGTAFLRTLQNILDLWRIKQGELPVEIQDVNLRETVDEAIFSVQDAAGDKPISIAQHIDDHLPKIRTDLAKVNQLLFLLLDNAVKFTNRGQVEILARVEDGHLVCEVRDTGIGICPDDQQYIFDEFFQVDEPASHRYRGAGLGLTLVRDLVILLEGEIELSSEVGSGSRFSFRIPVQVVG